jgi:hypothetical protein
LVVLPVVLVVAAPEVLVVVLVGMQVWEGRGERAVLVLLVPLVVIPAVVRGLARLREWLLAQTLPPIKIRISVSGRQRWNFRPRVEGEGEC